MAEKKKGLGDALIGLFVVREDGTSGDDEESAPAKSTASDPAVDELIAKYAGGGAATGQRAASRPPAPPVPAAATGTRPATRPPRPPVAPTAAEAPAVAAPQSPAASAEPLPEVKVDFPSVLRKAGLTDEEQSRVDKTLSLLAALPADTPLDIKRQIVGASLQAFGIPIEQIIEAAVLQIRAFDKHSLEGQKQTLAFLEQGNRRIAELEKELSRIRSSMQEQQSLQKGLELTCNQRKRRVQDVLDFFGPDAVDKATKVSAKLRQNQAT
ncbi:MAG TPA: hypothetical protein PKI49_00735 [Pseudomonadota bacterium]|nr:hypothetical protein [Pseudomonadota bacterium]